MSNQNGERPSFSLHDFKNWLADQKDMSEFFNIEKPSAKAEGANESRFLSDCSPPGGKIAAVDFTKRRHIWQLHD